MLKQMIWFKQPLDQFVANLSQSLSEYENPNPSHDTSGFAINVQAVMRTTFGYLKKAKHGDDTLDLSKNFLRLHYLPGVFGRSDAAALFGIDDERANQVLDRLVAYNLLEPRSSHTYIMLDHIWLFASVEAKKNTDTFSIEDREIVVQRFLSRCMTLLDDGSRSQLDNVLLVGETYANEWITRQAETGSGSVEPAFRSIGMAASSGQFEFPDDMPSENDDSGDDFLPPRSLSHAASLRHDTSTIAREYLRKRKQKLAASASATAAEPTASAAHGGGPSWRSSPTPSYIS
jgi:hypothetical protein